jgi:hypothetical protein
MVHEPVRGVSGAVSIVLLEPSGKNRRPIPGPRILEVLFRDSRTNFAQSRWRVLGFLVRTTAGVAIFGSFLFRLPAAIRQSCDLVLKIHRHQGGEQRSKTQQEW